MNINLYRLLRAIALSSLIYLSCSSDDDKNGSSARSKTYTVSDIRFKVNPTD